MCWKQSAQLLEFDDVTFDLISTLNAATYFLKSFEIVKEMSPGKVNWFIEIVQMTWTLKCRYKQKHFC